MSDDEGKIQLQNSLEQSLRPIEEHSEPDAMSLLALGMIDLLNDRTKVVEKFQSPEDLKTEITKSHRQIFPVLKFIAKSPYKSSTEYILKRVTDENKIKSIKNNMDSLDLNILNDYYKDFMYLGLAVDRKGRDEDLKSIGHLMSEAIELLNKKNNSNDNKKV